MIDSIIEYISGEVINNEGSFLISTTEAAMLLAEITMLRGQIFEFAESHKNELALQATIMALMSRVQKLEKETGIV